MVTVPLDPESHKFLEIVGYIILPVEEKIYREMPREDRGEFLMNFWARRDPNPETPVNEYRETYYLRMAVADKAFRKGTPGWKTDRGRIYILLGPPTNVIDKIMGDTPYEQLKFAKASSLDSGTLTERPTVIWLYDNYIEYFAGPLRLVFVDYHSTGDYKLQTKEQISAFSMMSPTWDQPNLAKYQWLKGIEMAEISRKKAGILDYITSARIKKDKGQKTVEILISIPYLNLDYRREGENLTCDLFIEAEIRDSQKRVLTKQGEPYTQTLPSDLLKSRLFDRATVIKRWVLDLPEEGRYIYICLTDRVRNKRLRKLLEIK